MLAHNGLSRGSQLPTDVPEEVDEGDGRTAQDRRRARHEHAELLGIEPGREPLEATRWRDAIRYAEQWKKAGKEAGPKVAAGAVIVAAGALFIIPQTRGVATKALAKALRTFR